MSHSRYSRVLAKAKARCRHIKPVEPLTLAEREARRKLEAEAAGDLYLPSKAWLQAQQQQQEGAAVFDPQTESLLEQMAIANAAQQAKQPAPQAAPRDPALVRVELGPTDQEHQSEAI